ncbi:hypothetical protein ABK040_006906 [Willaertia magna]
MVTSSAFKYTSSFRAGVNTMKKVIESVGNSNMVAGKGVSFVGKESANSLSSEVRISNDINFIRFVQEMSKSNK